MEHNQVIDLDMTELLYGGEVPPAKEDGRSLSSFEALAIYLNTKGRVNLPAISRIYHIPLEKLAFDLRDEGVIVQDPRYFTNADHWNLEDGWMLANEYVTGDVDQKLEEAQELEDRFPGCFLANLRILKKYRPEWVSLDQVYCPLGAIWIPDKYYEEFVKETMGLWLHPRIYYAREKKRWRVEAPLEVRRDLDIEARYGTKEMGSFSVLECTMNNRDALHYQISGNWNYRGRLDQKVTMELQERQRNWKKDFDLWCKKDPKRKRELEICYNRRMTSFCFMPFDGSFWVFPDLNPAVNLYDYQRNGIVRVILGPNNCLLAYNAGAGKTHVMEVAAHELYRLEISKKNMIVCQKQVLQDMVNNHRFLYPKDRILAIYAKDFTPARRQAVLKEIRDGDYTAIYLSDDSFKLIPLSKEHHIQKMEREIRRLKKAAEESIHAWEKKALTRQAEKTAEKLAKYMLETPPTEGITFEELGIRTLFVDEAHLFKNLPLESKITHIAGKRSKGSKKCVDLLEKLDHVNKVVFASGTPVPNSLADFYSLMVYLMPKELKYHDLDSFDMWINVFGERETHWELDLDGSTLRAVTRFSNFHNLPELMNMFSLVCDYYQQPPDQPGLPRCKGYIKVNVPSDPLQQEYFRNLSRRIDLIRDGKVNRTEDNLLKVTLDGRSCALDYRLVDPDAAVTPKCSKIAYCAKNVHRLYQKYPNCSQVVFSDIGTPKDAFNVYDALKEQLVELGIPPQEIAYVHDATSESARARLFENINKGKIRVVIGSTEKLGIGVNIQEALVACHHLSVPWRPADLTQRDHRCVRQGNTCEEVFIFCYITEQTFDGYSWQLLENKQRFIGRLFTGERPERDQSDVDGTMLTYAEMKALAIGDPLVRLRVETANRLEREQSLCRLRYSQLSKLEAAKRCYQGEITEYRNTLRELQQDQKFYAQCREALKPDERLSFGEVLVEALRENVDRPDERYFDEYQGFDVFLPARMKAESPHVYLRGDSGRKYYLEMLDARPRGCCVRLDHYLNRFDERIEQLNNKIRMAQKQVDNACEELEQGNPHQDTVDRLTIEVAKLDRQLAKRGKQTA